MPYNETTKQVWDKENNGCEAEVVAYTTEYLGHSWPTTLGLDSSGAPNNTAQFNLTDPGLVEFFGTWYLPEWAVERWAH